MQHNAKRSLEPPILRSSDRSPIQSPTGSTQHCQDPTKQHGLCRKNILSFTLSVFFSKLTDSHKLSPSLLENSLLLPGRDNGSPTNKSASRLFVRGPLFEIVYINLLPVLFHEAVGAGLPSTVHKMDIVSFSFTEKSAFGTVPVILTGAEDDNGRIRRVQRR